MVEILQLATKEHYFNKGTLLTSYKLRSLKQYSNKVFLVTLNSIKCQLMHYSVVNCFESFLEKKTNKTSKISNFDFFKLDNIFVLKKSKIDRKKKDCYDRFVCYIFRRHYSNFLKNISKSSLQNEQSMRILKI